jgi:DNA-binding HxlR family transcriptional regulator
MKLRLEDKRKAIELRVQGKSYREIMATVPNLSKSTLSGWLKNVKLTLEQEERLRKNIEKITYSARVKAAWTKKQKRIAQIRYATDQAKKELPSLLKNPLFLIGLSLYWAEGSKSNESIQFANSDPRLIKIMMKWFREICKAPEEKIRIHIYIHKVYRNENCEEFWSKITGVPVSRFGKTTYKPTPHRVKKNLDYKGVCRIDMGNVNLFRRIMGWQQGISEIFNKK